MSTFYACRLDAKIYLTIVFGNFKTEKDRQITGFMNEICNELHGVRLIELLRSV